jgi:DNA repair exonuclease SbcCD ATPase subunit
VAFAFELLLLLHFSLTISRLADQNKVLAQRLGLVRQRVEEQEARLEQQEQQLSELRAQAGLESPGKPGPSERELSRVR